MDMSIIRPLLVADMKQRLITERRLGSDYILPQTEDMIEQIGKCYTMSDINQLLCNYHMLFLDETECLVFGQGISVVSVNGTQEYVMGLLTKRIAIDLEIFNTIKLEAPLIPPIPGLDEAQSPLGPLKHEYKNKD